MKIKCVLSFRNICGQQPFIHQEVNVFLNVQSNVFTKTRKDKNMSTAINRMTIGLVLVIGIAVLFSTQAQAQPKRMKVEDRVKILKDNLKLSDEQSVKITKILEDQREEMTTSMNENRDNRDAMQTARQEIMKKTNEQIKSVLTEDQAKKYDEMFKGRRARMGQRTRESGK
jgi:Spy/CpxP family protein refolding chaperone